MRRNDEFREILLAQDRSRFLRATRVLVPCAAIAATLCFSTASARARACIIGACFSVIESATYWKSGRDPFTSADQFYANVVYGALALDRWQRASTYVSSLQRVALGPLTIWTLEIVENYALLLAFGRNTAWCYAGCHPYDAFHGAVDVSMARLWWGLALVLEVAYPRLVVPLGASFAPRVDVFLAATAVAVAGLAVAGAPIPRYPPAPSTFPKGQLETRGIALVDCRGAFPRIVELHRGDRRPRYDVAGRRLLLSGD